MTLELWLLLPVFIGASWLIASLLVDGEIFSGVREFVWRRFPVVSFHYKHKHVKDVITSSWGTVGTAKAWPFRNRMAGLAPIPGIDEAYWVPLVSTSENNYKARDENHKIGYLFTCMDCMPVWTSALVVFGFFTIAGSGPSLVLQAVIWLTTSKLVSIAESYLG